MSVPAEEVIDSFFFDDVVEDHKRSITQRIRAFAA